MFWRCGPRLRAVEIATHDHLPAMSGVTTTAEQLFQNALNFHEKGEVQRAEHLYREVLRQAPSHAPALNMLGVIGCQTGNLSAGIGLIRRAIELQPGQADFCNNLGMALFQSQDSDGACAAFEQAISVRPRFAEAHFNLANLKRNAGDAAAAEKHFRKALKAQPDYPDALNNLANLLRQSGKLTEATQLFRRLVHLQPGFAPGHFNLALALQAQAQHAEAIAAFQKSLALDDTQADVWAALGRCQQHYGALADAEQSFQAALSNGPATPLLLNALGLARYAQNKIVDARASFEQALLLDERFAITLNHLGMTASAAGEREDAIAYFERALFIDAGFGDAYRNLVELHEGDAEQDGLLPRIEAALANKPAGAGRVELDFALARLHDRRGDFDAAFAAFRRANDARQAVTRYDARGQNGFIDALIAVFSSDYLQVAYPCANNSDVPVFIVGMPRSGTTLVEQIIATHSDVHGSGELTYFPEHVPKLARRLVSKKPFPFCLRGREADIGDIGEQYLEGLSARGSGVARVTDKMPYNFLYLGIIAMLFPRARVIHCKRAAMATCFSIYCHDLAGSHPYAYELDNLAAAYLGYERLMAHWRAHLPIPMHEIEYESLLSEPDSESRALIEFLGLKWQPACLDFHQNRRPVVTASQWQVRQPLYTTSAAHWRNYAQHLEPLRLALNADSTLR
jgi:tetratricopeptide (TPR) repeat protein